MLSQPKVARKPKSCQKHEKLPKSCRATCGKAYHQWMNACELPLFHQRAIVFNVNLSHIGRSEQPNIISEKSFLWRYQFTTLFPISSCSILFPFFSFYVWPVNCLCSPNQLHAPWRRPWASRPQMSPFPWTRTVSSRRRGQSSHLLKRRSSWEDQRDQIPDVMRDMTLKDVNKTTTVRVDLNQATFVVPISGLANCIMNLLEKNKKKQKPVQSKKQQCNRTKRTPLLRLFSLFVPPEGNSHFRVQEGRSNLIKLNQIA